MTETERVKKWVDSKRYPCPYCQIVMIRHTSKSCRDCHVIARGTSYKDATLADLKNRHGRYWTGPVRENARRMFKGKPECVICGYNIHYEVAHIQSISSFNDDSLISEVNNDNNLIALCRNHHWEYDHGLITLPTPC